MSRTDDAAGGRRAAEQVAMQRANREQAEVMDVRNAVLGETAVGNRQITAEEANELRKGAASQRVDAAAVLDFSRNLADMAEAADDPQRDEEEEREVEEEIARDTAIADEVEQGMGDPEDGGDDDPRREKQKSNARRHLATDKKTSGMGGGDGPADPGDSDAPAAVSERPVDDVDGLPPVSVVPRKRAAHIELDAILVAGRDHGILPSYFRHRAGPAVAALTSRNFTRLFHALNIAGSRVGRALVVKALLVHQPPGRLVPFARALAEAGRDLIVANVPGEGAPDEPPADASAAEVRAFWDPLVLSGVDEHWEAPLAEEAGGEPWGVPKWLRGVPRAPLDVALVALQLALQGVLEPPGTTDGGAGAELARAFEAEGDSHPALQRWLLRILAEATDRDGLLAARDAMLRARSEAARPWTAPSSPGRSLPWR